MHTYFLFLHFFNLKGHKRNQKADFPLNVYVLFKLDISLFFPMLLLKC